MPGAKCNVDAIRAGEILKETPEITDAQDAELAELFTHYLFYCRHTDGRYFTCSGCGQRWVEPWLVQLETPEWRQAMQGKHNEAAVCPRCGRKVILKQERLAKSRDKLWEQARVLFLRAAPDGGLYGRAALAIKSYAGSMTPKIDLSEKERFYWKTPDAEHPAGTCLQAHCSGFWHRQLYLEGSWTLKATCCEPWPITSGMGYNAIEKDYHVIGVCLIGAGGGGGNNGGTSGSVSGGGSGCLTNFFMVVVPGDTMNIVVGAGGAAATGTVRAPSGGSSSLVYGGISKNAPGGGGGNYGGGSSGDVQPGGRCSDFMMSNNTSLNAFSGLGTIENGKTQSSGYPTKRCSSIEQRIACTQQIVLLPGGGYASAWGSQAIPNNDLGQTGSSGNSGLMGTAYGCGGCGGQTTGQNAAGADGACLIYAWGYDQ